MPVALPGAPLQQQQQQEERPGLVAPRLAGEALCGGQKCTATTSALHHHTGAVAAASFSAVFLKPRGNPSLGSLSLFFSSLAAVFLLLSEPWETARRTLYTKNQRAAGVLTGWLCSFCVRQQKASAGWCCRQGERQEL